MQTPVIDLTMQQCIELATKGYLYVNGETWYKRCKCQFLGDAMNKAQAGEVIYRNKSMNFILTQKKYESQPVKS